MARKHTKIVATISDLNCSVELLTELHEAGMDVVRLNTAHQGHDDTQVVVDNVRKVSEEIALLIDTKGPEIRSVMHEGIKEVPVTKGDTVTFTKDASVEKSLWVNYEGFITDVPVGATILVDDGIVGMTVTGKTETSVICEIQNSGVIEKKKGINVPDVAIDLPSLTERDLGYIQYSIDQNIDFIAHSFVRNAADVLAIQEILDEQKSDIKIISKIENRQGVDNIEEILDVSYGIMVARGDLGIEIPEEEVPIAQKIMIEAARAKGKPVITATQMLHTMIDNPRATRAEVSDVANSIFDGTDAIMLSGETAKGEYPVEAVQTMTRIAVKIEEAKEDMLPGVADENLKNLTHRFLARAAIEACNELDAQALVAYTEHGTAARILSSFRGRTPIYTCMNNKRVIRELSLSYGVYPSFSEKKTDIIDYITDGIEQAKADGAVESGDNIVILTKTPGTETGSNCLEITTPENWIK